MRLRVLIAEDTEAERAMLEAYIRRWGEENGLAIDLLCFADGLELVEHYPQNPDLILMDIDMAGLDGVSAARKVRERDEKVILVFVTRMVQYALEGYEVDAADFLIKPLVYPLFAGRMDRVLRKIRQRTPRCLQVRSGREQVSVPVSELVCVEALNKRTVLHLAAGTQIETREPLYSLEKQLEGEAFCRCHNAFLVSLSHVQRFTAASVSLPGVEAPVSKYRKQAFFAALAEYQGSMI